MVKCRTVPRPVALSLSQSNSLYARVRTRSGCTRTPALSLKSVCPVTSATPTDHGKWPARVTLAASASTGSVERPHCNRHKAKRRPVFYVFRCILLGSGRVKKVQRVRKVHRYLSYLNSHQVMWYHFLHQGKNLCQNPFSH